MKTKGRRKDVEGKVLKQGSCPSCGTSMREAEASLKFLVNGEEISVPESSHLRCPKCKEIVLRLDEARKLRERAHDLYRDKYGLLSAEEIRSLRERFDLTQAELSHFLGLGQNSLSRWESGRTIQSVAMDYLLRLVRDVPGTLDYLRKLAA